MSKQIHILLQTTIGPGIRILTSRDTRAMIGTRNGDYQRITPGVVIIIRAATAIISASLQASFL